jgi:hypothetical protein
MPPHLTDAADRTTGYGQMRWRSQHEHRAPRRRRNHSARKVLLAILAGVLMGYATVGDTLAEVSRPGVATAVAIHDHTAPLSPPAATRLSVATSPPR